MQIIIGQEAADALSGNYTVLELETFINDGAVVKAFCVVNAVPVMQLMELENQKALHSKFVEEYYNGNYQYCIDAVEHLRGKFAGEVDSFYDEILSRIL